MRLLDTVRLLGMLEYLVYVSNRCCVTLSFSAFSRSSSLWVGKWKWRRGYYLLIISIFLRKICTYIVCFIKWILVRVKRTKLFNFRFKLSSTMRKTQIIIWNIPRFVRSGRYILHPRSLLFPKRQGLCVTNRKVQTYYRICKNI